MQYHLTSLIVMLLSSDLLLLVPVLYVDSFKPTHLVLYCYTGYTTHDFCLIGSIK